MIFFFSEKILILQPKSDFMIFVFLPAVKINGSILAPIKQSKKKKTAGNWNCLYKVEEHQSYTNVTKYTLNVLRYITVWEVSDRQMIKSSFRLLQHVSCRCLLLLGGVTARPAPAVWWSRSKNKFPHVPPDEDSSFSGYTRTARLLVLIFPSFTSS